MNESLRLIVAEFLFYGKKYIDCFFYGKKESKERIELWLLSMERIGGILEREGFQPIQEYPFDLVKGEELGYVCGRILASMEEGFYYSENIQIGELYQTLFSGGESREVQLLLDFGIELKRFQIFLVLEDSDIFEQAFKRRKKAWNKMN